MILCDGCGKKSSDVEVMITINKSGGAICNECVARCNAIIEGYRREETEAPHPIPSPAKA